MSHSSEEAADIATGSITETAFEEALAQVEREDGAPSAVEAEESWPSRHLALRKQEWLEREVDVVAETAAEVETGRRSKRNMLLTKQPISLSG